MVAPTAAGPGAGTRGSARSAQRQEPVGHGGRRTSGTPASGRRTDPSVSLAVAYPAEAAGQDGRSAESENPQAPTDGGLVVRDLNLCFSDGLATRGQPAPEPAAVSREPASPVSGTGELSASGYAEPAAGRHRGGTDRDGASGTDPAIDAEEEVLPLPDRPGLSRRH